MFESGEKIAADVVTLLEALRRQSAGRYACVLDPARRPVLHEHRVAGTVIVPAAAFIELGHAAGADVFGGAAVHLENGWLRSALVCAA